jgi:hypothetical protein
MRIPPAAILGQLSGGKATQERPNKFEKREVGNKKSPSRARARPPLHHRHLLSHIRLLSLSFPSQAMDRCHRLGQDKPVLVFRLATANSVEGKLLKRANSKLMLERLVIKKGAFLPGTAEV